MLGQHRHQVVQFTESAKTADRCFPLGRVWLNKAYHLVTQVGPGNKRAHHCSPDLPSAHNQRAIHPYPAPAQPALNCPLEKTAKAEKENGENADIQKEQTGKSKGADRPSSTAIREMTFNLGLMDCS